jgi:aminoglycoside 3-N-acetyltransferase I
MTFDIERLCTGDTSRMRELNAMFGEAFGDPETYHRHPPDDAYAAAILSDPNVILLVATADERVIGGLGAYRLPKFEQARSEIYIYDLAVAEDWRRRGVAVRLIEELRRIGRETGCWMIFVQADLEDEPALALYRKLAVSEEQPLHFDIAP